MIYLVRHAESIANTQGIYQGQTYDTVLSPLGIKQAQALKRRLANIGFYAVHCSPLKRTLQTAQFLGQVTIESALLETNHGRWEGLTKQTIEKRWPKLYAQWFDDPTHVVFPKGESFHATQKRVLMWWRQIDPRAHVAIMTHDNILRIIIANTLNLPLSSLWQFHLYPAAITIIDDRRLACLNDTSHLTGLETNLATHAL